MAARFAPGSTVADARLTAQPEVKTANAANSAAIDQRCNDMRLPWNVVAGDSVARASSKGAGGIGRRQKETADPCPISRPAPDQAAVVVRASGCQTGPWRNASQVARSSSPLAGTSIST